MSNVLGYDPERLARLQGLLADLRRERRRLDSDDPAATASLRDYHRAVDRLVDYLPRVGAILGCSSLTVYRPVSIAEIDLRFLDVVRPTGVDSWAWSTDPLAAGVLTDDEAATRLGSFLAGGAGLLHDDAQLDALAARVEAASRSGSARAALLRELGPAAFTQLVHDLDVVEARRGAEHSTGARRLVVALSTAMGIEAQREQHHLADAGASPWRAWVAGLDGYDRLVVLAAAPLPPVWAAPMAADAWHHLVVPPPGPLPAVDGFGPDVPRSSAQLVTDTMRDPAMAVAILALLSGPDLAVLTSQLTDHRELAERIVTAADPDHRPPGDVATVLRALVVAFHDQLGLLDAPLARAVGTAFGRQLLAVVPPNDATRSGPIDWQGLDPVGFVRGLATRPQAAEELAAWLGVTVATETRAVATVDDAAITLERMAHLGLTAGTTVTALLDADETHARKLLAAWHREWSAGARVLSLLGGEINVPWVASKLVTNGVRLIITRIDHAVVEHQLLGAPDPIDHVLARISDQARAFDATFSGLVLAVRDDVARVGVAAPPDDRATAAPPSVDALLAVVAAPGRDRDPIAASVAGWSGTDASRLNEVALLDAFRSSYGWATDHRRARR